MREHKGFREAFSMIIWHASVLYMFTMDPDGVCMNVRTSIAGLLWTPDHK